MEDSSLLKESFGLDVDTSMILYSSGPIVFKLFGLSLMGYLASRLVSRMARRIDDPRTQRQLEFFAPKIVNVLVIAVGLEFAGVDITGMAALFTTVGFTGAVVFTPLGQNIVAGIVTSIDDLFEIGEVIEVNGEYGTVVSKSLLRTELRRPEGTTIWVPNKELSEEVTKNHTRMGGFRINVEIPLDNNPDRRRAVEIMDRVIAELPWNVPGKKAFIAFEDVADSAVVYRAYAFIRDRSEEP
ncbi:MAG: mechanosensitive ion channel, partial [Acidimicrobiales bacterium]|nr:mechanosensitive ion channel [Acidimicrobiales bacterium]NND13651.1 mechanosensitive ion channel [Acidimicrobiia bacterium]